MQLATADSPFPFLAAFGTVTRGERADAKTRVRGINLAAGAGAWAIGFQAWEGTREKPAATTKPWWDASSFGFTGREHELDSGLVYARARYLNPGTGRWDRPDPVTITDLRHVGRLMRHPQDQNLFDYVGAAPTRFQDPNGLTKLEFQVENDFLIVDPEVPGRPPYMMLATSGRDSCINQVSCQQQKKLGPIPLGFYTLYTNEISNPGVVGDFLRNLLGDWGDWRVALHPDAGTNTFGRDGFFLHGGRFFGSAGCIDFGGGMFGNALTNQLLDDLLADPDGVVPLAVVRD